MNEHQYECILEYDDIKIYRTQCSCLDSNHTLDISIEYDKDFDEIKAFIYSLKEIILLNYNEIT